MSSSSSAEQSGSPQPGSSQPGSSQSSSESSDLIYDPDVATQEWIDSCSFIPQNIGYNWFPFCRALVENHYDVSDILEPQPPPPVPDYIQAAPAATPPAQSPQNAAQPGDHSSPSRSSDVFIVKVPADKVPNKDPAKGSWKHLCYLPEWSDPDYTEKFVKTPLGRWRQDTYHDAIYNLRPALRLEDIIKKPTDYALRFGIAEGRLDGRSRMSPSWSQTRNPLDDFTNQVALLSDDKRAIAVELSRQRRARQGQMPSSTPEISPQILEGMLKFDGLLTNAELKAELIKAANAGMSLDQMIEELEAKHPRLREVHRNFLDNALDDQEYQRVCLGGLTTDELIQNNVHTMSNDVVDDLDNPIHFLFQRDRWADSRWKGSDEEHPKLVYNMNGSREEWNVRTNDRLWDALQPALRLASMILAHEPPIIEALYNMCTRQPIDPKFDARPDPQTPTLTKYVLQEDIDMDLTYPPIRALEETYLFEWKAEVLQLLGNRLELDLESGYTLGEDEYNVDFEVSLDEPYSKYSLGSTCVRDEEGGQKTIQLRLAVENVWPLLVDQYSASEKMACSFEIAKTLLHEYGHCINQALYLLCSDPTTHGRYITPNIAALLLSLEDTVFDTWYYVGEPFFGDSPELEVGFDVEQALFGPSEFLHQHTNRHYSALNMLYHNRTHPHSQTQERTDTVRPLYNYSRSVPLDIISRFFRKDFWAGEFAAYGWAALKVKSDNFTQKYRWHAPVNSDGNGMLIKYTGEDGAKFLRTVIGLLYRSRQRVLANYLRSRLEELNYADQYERWCWAHVTYNNWKSHEMNPLPRTLDLLFAEFHAADALSATVGAVERAVPDGDWQKTFGVGGTLLQTLAIAHTEMQNDIGYLQRVTFTYPFLTSRGGVLNRRPNDTISWIEDRLFTYRHHAGQIALRANDVLDATETASARSEWSAFRNRFYASAREYDRMLSDLSDAVQKQEFWFNCTAKARYNTLPTDYWRLPSTRYEKMAIREYQRAPKAVRDTIDDFLDKLNEARLSTKIIPSRGGTLKHSFDGLGDNRPRPLKPTTSIFDWRAPAPRVPRRLSSRSARQSARGQSAVNTAAPGQSEPPSTPMTGVIFGEPGGAQPSLDDAAPRRISTRPPSTSGAAFQNYATNLLASPSPAPNQTAPTPAPASSNIFAQPQPIRRVSPGSSQLGQGGNGRPAFQLFPNPFADSATMTSEAVAFEEQRRLREQAAQMQDAAGGVYTSRSLWRETTHDDSDDEMVM